MKTAKTAAICGITSLALACAGLAGCGDKVDGTKTALVINDEEINVGTANFYLRHQQAETESMMESYGMSSGSMWGTGTSEDDYGIQFKESTTDTFIELVLQRQHAEDYGVSLTEEDQQKIQEAAQSFADSNPEAMERIGATVDDIVQVLELYTYQNRMWDPMVEDTDREVTDEEAAQTTITYARIPLTEDDEAVSNEEKAARLEDAEAVLSQIQASADPSTVEFNDIAEAQNEDFVEGSYSYGSDDTVMPDEVHEAVDTLTDGQVYGSVLETDEYYYIVRLDQAFDQEATESKKQSIILERENDNYSNKLQEWKDASSIEETSAWKSILVSDKDLYLIKAADTTSSDSSTDSTSTSGSSSTEGASTSSSSSAEGAGTSRSVGAEGTSTSSSEGAEETSMTSSSSAAE